MKYEEREELIKALDPEVLGKTPHDQQFRFALLMLLGDIAGNLDSLSAAYRELVNMQKAKAGK